MKQRDHRNIVIGVLCSALLVMGVGFAYLTSALTINGSVGVKNATWDVKFTNIATVANPTSTNVSNAISEDGLTANFNVLLTQPGDTVTYTLTVKNSGTIDAKISNIEATTPTETTGNKAIKFSYEDIKDRVVKAGESTTMAVTFTYDSTASSAANSEVALATDTTTSLGYTITFDCVQNTD